VGDAEVGFAVVGVPVVTGAAVVVGVTVVGEFDGPAGVG